MLDRIREAIAERGRAMIALSGGSTPAKLFPRLAEGEVDWTRVHVFFVDERMVPPTHEASNFRLAQSLFLALPPVPVANVHRVRGEDDPEDAAAAYEAEIAEAFGLDAEDEEIPAFDIVHLGMGDDAHIASLFPGEAAIDDLDGIAAALYVEKLDAWRVTLLPAVLQAARCTVLLIAGAGKAAPLEKVLVQPYNPKQYPAQLVRHNLEVHWFLDQPAKPSEEGMSHGRA
ncbi:MAG: 6-phosphogluconolactonase [Bryobacterales bacterium]|nr:6-phosphogluconolactonase [Bryobacterales bacterium]